MEKLDTNEIRESLKKLTNIDEYSIPKKLKTSIPKVVQKLEFWQGGCSKFFVWNE